jgi:hypothetical protein
VSVRHLDAQLRVGRAFRPQPNLEVFAGAGGGFASYEVSGEAAVVGYLGRTARHPSPFLSLGAAASLFPTEWFGAFASLETKLALDAPTVRVNDRVVGHVGRPEVALALGPSVRF